MKIRISDHGNTACAALLRRSIADRIPLEDGGDLGPLYALAIDPDLTVPGSFRIGGRSCEMRIGAADKAGLLYGIGKLLRTGTWEEDWFTPDAAGPAEVPETERRAVTVSVSELSPADEGEDTGAPGEDLSEESRDLLTTLAFFGCNTVVLALPEDFPEDDPRASACAAWCDTYGIAFERIVSEDAAVSGAVPFEARAGLEIERIRFLAGLWKAGCDEKKIFEEYCNLHFVSFLAPDIARIAEMKENGRTEESAALIRDTEMLLPERVRSGWRWRSLISLPSEEPPEKKSSPLLNGLRRYLAGDFEGMAEYLETQEYPEKPEAVPETPARSGDTGLFAPHAGKKHPALPPRLAFLLPKIISLVLIIAVFLMGKSGDAVRPLLRVLLAVGVVVTAAGAVGALRAVSVDHVVFRSAAAQAGCILMCLGIGGTDGCVAALLHLLSCAVTEPLLYLASRRLSAVSGESFELDDLKGAARRDPWSGAFFTAGALSMTGIPLLSGFAARLLIAMTAVDTGDLMTILPVLLALAVYSVLNALYFIRSLLRIWYDPDGADALYEPAVRLPRTLPYAAVSALLTLANLMLGLFSQEAADLLARGLSLFS